MARKHIMEEETTCQNFKVCNAKNLKRVNVLFKYLKTTYKLELDEEFARKLIKKACSDQYPTIATIEGLVKEWKFWEKYVTPDSFEKFIKQGLLDMFWFQCTATSYCQDNKDMYLGHKAKVIDPSKLPFQTATVVKLNGNFFVNGRLQV